MRRIDVFGVAGATAMLAAMLFGDRLAGAAPGTVSPATRKSPAVKGPPVDKSAGRTKLPDTVKQPGLMKQSPGDKTSSPPNKPAAPKGGVSRPVVVRDPQPLVTVVDREWSEALSKAGLEPSPEADDAEFLRRVTLDLTGQVPTYQETVAYLADADPEKRRRLVDDLLYRRAFGLHFGRAWRRLILPPDYTMAKSSVDRLTPWIAEQFDAGRPWNEVVVDFLTAEGSITHDPRGAFYLANSDMTNPQPNLLANSAGRLFLGVQIGCAECHHHPFAPWTQDDFWGLAACFCRVRKVSKSDASLTEAPSGSGPAATTAEIVVPEGAGKAVGRKVAARFLDGRTQPRGDAALRPQLAAWITARENAQFARAQVNRLWANLFGRGLVHPVDDLRAENPATHPVVLDRLAEEFASADFDVRHILRALCLSRAYRTTSVPTAANAADDRLLSHQRVKVLNPDMLYDALHTVLNSDPSVRVVLQRAKPTKPVGRSSPVVVEPRESFVRFFSRASLGDDPLQYGYGIPQMLRLLNGREWNAVPPFVVELATNSPDRRAAIETLYLVVLARRPTGDEVERLLPLVDGGANEKKYAAPFWVLVNSSEFVVNR
jgi:hypothetical protein